MMRAAATPTPLDELAEYVRPVTLTRDRRLPVLGALETLLPRGLPRGKAVAITTEGAGGGATTLGLALAARAATEGTWVAVVGHPDLGLLAAAGLGIPFDRIALVQRPGNQMPAVIAALVDGFDIVIVDPRVGLTPRDTRRLLVRLRERDAVMIVAGGDLHDGGAAVRLRIISSKWEGLGRAGHLQARRAVIEATGRGAESQQRRDEIWLPSANGTVAPIDEPPPPLLRRPQPPTRHPSQPGRLVRAHL